MDVCVKMVSKCRVNIFALLMILALSKGVLGGLHIEFHFLRYSDTCREDLSTSACDPKFTFCLDRARASSSISPCYYKSAGESGYFQNTNVIDLNGMSSIKGIPNPWIVYVNQLRDTSIRFVVRVRDDDTTGSDDDLAFLGITLSETIYPSQSSALWANRQITSGSYLLTFQIRIYCEANYYAEDCSIYCLAADSDIGHYTCDSVTGNKICMKGWTGQDCSEDLDECAENYCQRGRCENYPGDYVCYCPSDYTGKNCTIKAYPCDQNPCRNNASCINAQGMNYTCNCVGDWEGDLCEVKLNPCKVRPCQNGMECIPSDDHSNYTCNCLYPFTGINCKDTILENITTTTANITVKGNYTQQIEDPVEKSEFQSWYIILIVIPVIIIIVVIIFLILKRCRKPKDNSARNDLERQDFDDNKFNNVIIKHRELSDDNKQQLSSPMKPVASTKSRRLSDFCVINVKRPKFIKNPNDWFDDLSYAVPAGPPKIANNRACEHLAERLERSEHATANDYSYSPSNTCERQPDEEAQYANLDEMEKTIPDEENDEPVPSLPLKRKTPVPTMPIDKAMENDYEEPDEGTTTLTNLDDTNKGNVEPVLPLPETIKEPVSSQSVNEATEAEEVDEVTTTLTNLDDTNIGNEKPVFCLPETYKDPASSQPLNEATEAEEVDENTTVKILDDTSIGNEKPVLRRPETNKEPVSSQPVNEDLQLADSVMNRLFSRWSTLSPISTLKVNPVTNNSDEYVQPDQQSLEVDKFAQSNC